jgi:hypothetical protein
MGRELLLPGQFVCFLSEPDLILAALPRPGGSLYPDKLLRDRKADEVIERQPLTACDLSGLVFHRGRKSQRKTADVSCAFRHILAFLLELDVMSIRCAGRLHSYAAHHLPLTKRPSGKLTSGPLGLRRPTGPN